MTTNSFFVRMFQSQTQELDQLITGQNPDYYNRILNKNPIGPEQMERVLQRQGSVPTQQIQQMQQQQQPPTQPVAQPAPAP